MVICTEQKFTLLPIHSVQLISIVEWKLLEGLETETIISMVVLPVRAFVLELLQDMDGNFKKLEILTLSPLKVVIVITSLVQIIIRLKSGQEVQSVLGKSGDLFRPINLVKNGVLEILSITITLELEGMMMLLLVINVLLMKS